MTNAEALKMAYSKRKDSAGEERDFLNTIIQVLKQESCGDAISRQAVLDAMYELCNTWETLKENPWRDNPHIDAVTDVINNLPSVTPAEKVGRWILVQRGKYVDLNCSECGFSRIKEFAYNYTVEDISEQEFRDFVENNKMNFCECCGAKMQGV